MISTVHVCTKTSYNFRKTQKKIRRLYNDTSHKPRAPHTSEKLKHRSDVEVLLTVYMYFKTLTHDVGFAMGHTRKYVTGQAICIRWYNLQK